MVRQIVYFLIAPQVWDSVSSDYSCFTSDLLLIAPDVKLIATKMLEKQFKNQIGRQPLSLRVVNRCNYFFFQLFFAAAFFDILTPQFSPLVGGFALVHSP